MNFTREPIIETIISAKDGYKLSIKSSKSASQDEYLVDAIEVVSYGGTFFYRSSERPKAFFVPATDYEVVEVRETRLLIKQPSIEKSIKIGGGKEASKPQKASIESTEIEPKAAEEAPKPEQKRDKKKNKRGKKGESREEKTEVEAKDQEREPKSNPEKGKVSSQAQKVIQEQVVPTVFSHLLQPPPTLISESLQKYKKSEMVTSAPEISEELSTHIDLTITESEIQTENGPETLHEDPELYSEPPAKEERLEELPQDLPIDEPVISVTGNREENNHEKD